MDLRDYARILRSRWRSIVGLTLVGLIAALAVSLSATPTYQSSTQLFVTTAGAGDNLNNQYTGSLFSQLRVKSYADIVRSPLVTEPVVDDLGLKYSAAALSAKITATAPLDKVLINVSVVDTDPDMAVRLANAVSQQFTKVVASIETTDGALASPVKLTVTQPATGAAQVTPRTNLNVALGVLVGLALGLGFAVLREQLDTRIKGARVLRDEFGLNTLGVIAFDPETPKTPLTVQIPPHSPRAESFRQLRTNLQFVDIDRPPHSLVVTSSLPSDGKSTTTCNLAIALAESGRNVLLVEADLRRPKLGDYLGLTGAVGLSDVLIGRVELEDAVQDWGTTGRMRVLLSGATPPNPAELLGSQQMADLLKHCEEEFFVVIDAPPLLPVTDAAVLSRIASGVVLVVRAGKTREDEVRQALANLTAVNARVYGGIINMAPTKGPDARGYGYGYGYGYEGRNTDTGAPVLPTPLGAPKNTPAVAQAASVPVATPPTDLPQATPASQNPSEATATPAVDNPETGVTPPNVEQTGARDAAERPVDAPAEAPSASNQQQPSIGSATATSWQPANRSEPSRPTWN